uniref:beta-fructofuranosidase n=1 Tax=Solibacter usitatus (strain Ellin6076) TaxID=234267 RepID=Q026K0_SOLUE
MDRRRFLQTAGAVGASKRILQAAEADPALVKATEAVLAAVPTAEADPERPIYHFRPPANWTNDPNGTIYYKGWHHLFYQLNPFVARIGSQHWGHARSRDLVNWEHLPIAIWPSEERGERAIFSGSAAIAADGRPRILYTSIGQAQPEQWLAIPKDDDLLSWEKFPGNPVLTQAAHIAGPISQWRDPFLFTEGGATYMVCGGGTAAGRAQVQLYKAAKPDFTEWRHLGAVFQTLDRESRNFECPNLFPLAGKWVMIVSPNRVCEYWIGDLDIAKVQFTPQAHGILDAGDAYASNISVDDKGRTILWLWGRTNTPQGKGWGSVMTMPRILSIGPDGYLLQRPAPEFESLRGAARSFPARGLETPFVPEDVAVDAAEIEAEFTGTGVFGLELRRSSAGKPGVTVTIQGGYVNVGNARAFVGNSGRYKLRVFLDRRCLEVNVNDGVAAVYNWFDAGLNDLGIAAFGRAGNGRGGIAPVPPRLESLRVWPMKPAKFSLDRFHV